MHSSLVLNGILPFSGNIQLPGEKLRTQGSKRVASLRANREERAKKTVDHSALKTNTKIINFSGSSMFVV